MDTFVSFHRIVSYIDIIAERIRQNQKLNKSQMHLAMVLEGGTWKACLYIYLSFLYLCTFLIGLMTISLSQAGRELAEMRRPHTKGPPIAIKSDGTLF